MAAERVRLQKRGKQATIGSMVTTIIAIYGAVVATVSTLLGVWYFARSGPSFQAKASVDPDSMGENREWDDTKGRPPDRSPRFGGFAVSGLKCVSVSSA